MRYIKSFQNDAAIQDAVDNQVLGKPYVALNDQTGKMDWNTKEETPDYSKMYLTIEALENGDFYVRAANVGYSVNGGTWQTTTGETELSINQGDAVRFRGTDGARGLFTENTLSFNAYGNVESLEYGDDFIGKTRMIRVEPFRYMFRACSNLISCKNLILPAINLGNGCYGSMFYECENLVSAPELPGVELMQACYTDMFGWCTKLNYIKCLAESGFDKNLCLYGWLGGVSTTGTFVKKAGVEWPTGESGIPEGWTVIEE